MGLILFPYVELRFLGNLTKMNFIISLHLVEIITFTTYGKSI